MISDLWTIGNTVRTATRQGVVHGWNPRLNIVTVRFVPAAQLLLLLDPHGSGALQDVHFKDLRMGAAA